MAWSKSVKESVIAVLLGLVFTLVLLEVVLRVLGGTILLTQENINRRGFAKGDAYRIMCIGESTTADIGRGYSYPRQLGEILNNRVSGMRFSVINKGQPSGNTQSIMAALEKDLDIYKPDMVVAMMGINDPEIVTGHEAEGTKKDIRLRDKIKILRLADFLSKDILLKRKVEKMLKGGVYLGSRYSLDKGRVSYRSEIFERPAADTLQRINWDIRNGKFDKAKILFEADLEKRPNLAMTYALFGTFCSDQGRYEDAEEIFTKVIEGKMYETDPAEWAGDEENGIEIAEIEEASKRFRQITYIIGSFSLAECYADQEKYEEAEKLYKKLMEDKPDRACEGLAGIYRKQGKIDMAREYEEKAKEYGPGNYVPTTKRNYRKLKDILDKRGIKLVCTQYPLSSVEPLKEIFVDREGIIFVDNEGSFKKAMRGREYDEYFTDRCYVNFGHATEKGNRLLAENIANEIIKGIDRDK